MPCDLRVIHQRVQLQAKKHWASRATSRSRKKRGFFPASQRKCSPACHLDFRLLAPRTMRKEICCLKPLSLWWLVTAVSGDYLTHLVPSFSNTHINAFIFVHLPTSKCSSPPKDNGQGHLLFNTHHIFLHLKEKILPHGGLTSEMPKMFKKDPTFRWAPWKERFI